VILDTREGMVRRPRRISKGAAYNLEGRSLAMFRLYDNEDSPVNRLARRRVEG
jgi:hypothetical protein